MEVKQAIPEMARLEGQKGVLIAIPTTGRPVPIAWAFALKMLTAPPVTLSTIYSVIGHPLDEARNISVQKAIDDNYKYIFFLDDDVVVPPGTLRRFLTILDNRPEVDFVSGVVCTRDESPQPMVFRELGNGPFWDWRVGEVFWANAGAIGASMIRVSAFSRVAPPWFKRVDDATGGVDEGMYFYDQLLKSYPVGAKPIWIDGATLCEHHDVNTGAVHVLPKGTLPWRDHAGA
jgi:glycosyltransferase involved in cell wall biosynthesis